MNDIDQAIQLGLEALKLGDTASALQHFSRAIAAVPPGNTDHPTALAEAWRRRGTLYFDLGRPHDAITDLTQAIALNPHHPQTLQTRALVRLALKNPAGAITDLQAAIELDATDPLSQQLLGTAQRRCSQIDAAIASFTRAARLYLNRGDADKSRQCLTQVDRLRPVPPASGASPTPVVPQNPTQGVAQTLGTPMIEPRAFYRQAIERAEAGDATGALQDLNWVLKSGDVDADALCCRAAIYSTQGKFQAAIADFNRVLSSDDQSAMAYGGRGRARLRLGDMAGALSDFDQAIAITPKDASLRVLRGTVYRDLGQSSQALAEFDQAIAIDPTCGAAYLERGTTHARKEDLTQAAEDYQQAARLFCEQEAWNAYKTAIGKAAKLNQAREPIDANSDRDRSSPQDTPHLQQKLLRLVGGIQEIADRLLTQCRENHPGHSEEWYLRQVIAEIDNTEWR
ncbi:MAG: tetratricopeptide repeat protein [Oscillatoriales cyanobacterium]|nr:MAG: tetratricopeptide repeat protein [Oscillatoriales cyanobacterium]